MTAVRDLPEELPHDAATAALTEKRMRRMRVFGGPAPTIDRSTLPPGPGWPPLLQSIGLLRFRHQFVPWAHRRYGDVFTVRLLPERARSCSSPAPSTPARSSPPTRRPSSPARANSILGPMMGEHSLLLQDGGEHQRARKLLMPAFNGHALREYGDLVTEVARAELATWHDGEELRALDRMNRLTLEVILRVVFGVTDERRLALLRPRVNRDRGHQPGRPASAGACHGCAGSARGAPPGQNAHELDQLIHAEIRERRTAPDLATRTDVLSRLIRARGEEGDALTDEELRDQLVTLLLAGHETTATALAWALYELGRDAGVAGPDHRGRRRRGRRLAGGRAQGVDAPAPGHPDGGAHAHGPGHDRRHRPAGGGDGRARRSCSPTPARRTTRSPTCSGRSDSSGPTRAPNTWIPFGGGVRRCIGAGFSLMEGVVVLRELLTAYASRRSADDRPKVRNITSVPRDGARIRVTAR